MQDMSGAHSVAPDGSRLGIMPTTSGGVATTPRAPGQDRPRIVPHSTARPDRPRATPRAPDQDVPRAFAARAPGADRPSAAPSDPVPDRLRPVQKAPGQERPLTAPSGAVGPDRPRATLRAPDQDVPRAFAARAPGADRLCAVAATVAAADESHVLPPAAGSDSSHRGPAAGPPPTSVTAPIPPAHDPSGRTYTAEEVLQPTPATAAPVLAIAVRLLQALIRRAQALDIARALDVLRRRLQDRPALTLVAERAPIRSLAAAATSINIPARPADPHTKPGAPPTDSPPFKPP